MAEWTPTKSQEAAIRAAHRSVLVSAAAGSGKTAVLSERCAHLVTDLKPPCPVNSLLVVTFTEAATAQMRRRIEMVLQRRLDRDPNNRWLQEQIALLDSASIQTIHGFCRGVLNRYFAQARLDPQTPVLDEHDATLLRRETAQAIMDGLADGDGAESEAIRELLAAYAGPREERMLDEALAVHSFLGSVADGDGWLEGSIQRLETGGDAISEFWIEALGGRLSEELRDQSTILAGYLSPIECECHPFTEAFAKCLGDYRSRIEEWRKELGSGLSAGVIESICKRIGDYEFCEIPSRRKKIEKDAEPAFERCKRHTEFARDKLLKGRLQRIYGTFSLESAMEGMRRTVPHLKSFVRLVQSIGREYEAAKRDQGVVDFSDLEQLCLRLLRDSSNGVAARLRDKYDFILVDEFQDVNPVQEEILRLVSREDDERRPANLFAVGDVKQSIYRFRLADPGLFVERRGKFPLLAVADNEARGVTIDLQENFRSRPGVIEAINRIFERIMTADLGGVDYDDQARLVPTKPEEPGGMPPLELHLLAPAERGESQNDDAGPDDALDWEQIEREACLIARRIQSLVQEGRRYSEIVILMRSLQTRASLFMRALYRAGIPVVAESVGGIFESLEVMDILSLLHLLDNAKQDIPLAAILRSPVMSEPFCDDDLAEIRIASRRLDRQMPFHEAARWYSNNGPRPELRERLLKIYERLGAWRQRIRRRPLADVLWEIYDETGYLAYVGGTREGPQRRANLLRLHEYARQFGTFSRQGLYRFLRFVEALAASDQDLDAGSASPSAQDVVRLMTIHRSKGLEFPVVIVAELGKRFNQADASGGILYDRRWGLALEAVDVERRIRYSTLPHKIVRQSILKESAAEELRILYVAMTRAEERLILVGTGDVSDFTDARSRLGGHAGPLPALARRTATSCLDWVIDAIACQDEGLVALNQAAGAATRFAIKSYPLEEMKTWTRDSPERAETSEVVERFTQLEAIPGGAVPDSASEVVKRVSRRLTTDYPAAILSRIPSVVAASALKRRWDVSSDPDEPAAGLPTAGGRGEVKSYRFPRPDFLSPGSLPEPTQVGTWTHELLQRIDLAGPCDSESIRAQLNEAIAAGRMAEESGKHIGVESVAWFLQSELARRLRAAKRVLREWPFVLGVDPARIDSAAADAATTQDVIIVRGMIDCLFDAGEGWEILDYKTDAVSDVSGRVEEYRGQLAIYAAAVEATWGGPVHNKWLVFLHPREIVQV